MPKIAELVQYFDPVRAKLICGDQDSGRLAPPGSIEMTFRTTAPTGWLLLTGSTIGNAASGGTARANADTLDLYTILWNSLSNTEAPVSGGRGASAAADFAAGKTITLPDMRQRFPIGKASSGTGSTLGGTGGNIDHTHSVPAHYHAMGTGADLNITSSGSGTTGAGTAHSHGLSQLKFAGTGSFPLVGATGADSGSSIGETTDSESAHTHSTPNHTHASGNIAGKIGLVTGGVDGNNAMTSGTANPPFLAVNFMVAY